ncbi:lantibiotic dehydratase C-terminal domain-containing protein [Streptomyces sp. KN37]|uniref:lantibiotic dehydratase C-terminal domain-containing protein n=1 Tax=Streptomyces sp. KN37 TaxID=3090667 RepID=UPI002A74C909|nr:lantibiotic dehydratase C-terminal domain-containing protein [Streptomyces sp. KN37]WPO69767.1 lantibiotic dehydratase C-terminal domain-containing protein [Streptomyces sp. KN37]
MADVTDFAPGTNSTSACPAPSWLSVHVHAHSDLDRHIGHLAGLLRNAAAEVDAVAWFFLRYWESGPHLRLRALCRTAGQRELAGERLRTAAEQWARDNPERSPLGEAEYAASSAWIQSREETGRPAAPLLPSRTVRVEEFTGAWMPGAPACTGQPQTLSFLSASSTVALHLHLRHGWQTRARHAVDTLRSLLAAPLPADCPPLRGAFAEWADLLAGDEAEDVRRRARLAQKAAWPGPDRAAAAMARYCLAVPRADGSARALLHAWHTHCNRLGLNLPEEAAAAITALALTEKENG